MRMRSWAFLAALSLATASVAFAADTDELIKYAPVSCVVADQLPVLKLDIQTPGELRAYYKFVNTTEWCWVQGNNIGPISTIVLPKFRPGQSIEYFFVVLKGKRIIAKSKVTYRLSATNHCDTLVARHSLGFAVDCGHEVSGGANSVVAANSFQPKDYVEPPHISPDTPVGTAAFATSNH
jgi:hypothetical protein